MAQERTLALIKPDAVRRGLMGEILCRIEKKGLRPVAMKMTRISRELAGRHYEEHRDKPFFGELVDFITSGPLVALTLEGPDAVAQWRSLMGATDPRKAAPGTIRGDLATVMSANLVHGADSTERAATEIALFFSEKEICHSMEDGHTKK